MKTLTKCIDNKYGFFFARANGATIQISIPAKTGNDWGRKETFLDLPSMDKETLDSFVKVMFEFQKMFNESIGTETSFDDRVCGWSRRFEDILIEIMKEKDKDGLVFLVNTMSVSKEFIKLIESMYEFKGEGKAYLRPGLSNLFEET